MGAMRTQKVRSAPLVRPKRRKVGRFGLALDQLQGPNRPADM
jgi:hypothetical protein